MLAQYYRVPKSSVEIARGHASKSKVVRVALAQRPDGDS